MAASSGQEQGEGRQEQGEVWQEMGELGHEMGKVIQEMGAGGDHSMSGGSYSRTLGSQTWLKELSQITNLNDLNFPIGRSFYSNVMFFSPEDPFKGRQ